VPVQPGERVTLDLGELGTVEIDFAG
jgi:2-keto-4-pentenoate hydratase